jgi:nucleoside-diphosphate-sugar epimerase
VGAVVGALGRRCGVSLFISALVGAQGPTIYGGGEQTRDSTYVTNVVDGSRER